VKLPRLSATVAALLYLALTLALTWPLAAGLARDIPGDFGDPLFTAWVMAWDATHLGGGWWHANIFAPHPLALAYSEHFLPQGVAALPIYLATKNPILGYNVVFLSTFVLSGLGMFLLGRDLTGSRAAGFVAGLAFAFTPVRIASLPHLQVLSAAWMPFVLYALRRHFASGRLTPLAAAVAAWIVQNLSCGYYLLFFSPIVLAYIVWEMTTRGLWRDPRAAVRVAGAVAVVVAATAPFLLPYLELRQRGFSPRSLAETKKFSADVYAYFTADPNLRLWGSVAGAFPKAEGLLFPGLTIVALALFAVVNASHRGVSVASGGGAVIGRAARRFGAQRYIGALAAGVALLIVGLLLGYSIRLPGLKITDLSRVLIIAAAAAAITLASSRDARQAVGRWLSSPVGFFAVMTLFSIAMSFGPEIRAKGRVVADTSVYAAFYSFAPGFDGVRVPARYAMIATLGLAALAAFGVAALARRRGWLPLVAGALIVVEAIAVPIPINQNSTAYAQPGLVALPPSISGGAAAPAVYRLVAQLPASAVLLELPLGEPAFDVRYMFYSTGHWRRLVNGYSGGAPLEYQFLTEALKDAATRPERAWQALAASAATHVVVHEGSYAGDGGRRLSAWLRTNGAIELGAFASDRVFVLP
jgi:hypothetical protein